MLIMRSNKNKIICMISIILIYGAMSFLIFCYADIACLTRENNLCHVPYEPSGLQMLYDYFVGPVFLLLSVVIYSLKRVWKTGVSASLFPLIVWFVFFCFITFIEEAIHFPAGNELFYQGSLLIAATLFILNTFLASKKIYCIVCDYS